MAGETSRVLVDLLQTLVSQTEWCCAEVWVPSNGKLSAHAFWVRTDLASSQEFRELELVTRSLALLPGVCIPGKVWQGNSCEWSQDLGSSLGGTPRSWLFNRAGLISSVAWSVRGDDNRVLGVIVLLSQHALDQNEEQFNAMEALSKCSTTYLESIASHQNSQGQFASLNDEQQDSFVIEADDIKQKVRNQIKYKSPARDASMLPRKTKVQERPASCMIQLKAALSKFPSDQSGNPNVSRVAICWNMLEQLCEFVASWNDVLSLIRDEIRPALFSDDLMSSDDGLSLVKVPYFAQIAAVINNNKQVNEVVSEYMRELNRLNSELGNARCREENALSIVHNMEHTLLLSKRKLIKNRLNTFLERRGLSAKINKEYQGEIEALKSRVQELEKTLSVEIASHRHDILFSTSDVEVLKESLQTVAVHYPTMTPSLRTGPVRAAAHAGDLSYSLPSKQDEFHAMRIQLLVLRNACLTEFENRHQATDGNESLRNQHQKGFIEQMDEIQKEIKALDSRIARGFESPHYDLMDPAEVADARRKSHRAAARASIFDSMPVRDSESEPSLTATRESLQVISNKEIVIGDGDGDVFPTDEEKILDWTEKELHNPLRVNIWRGYEVQCKDKRLMWRTLAKSDVLRLVYQVFEYKAKADVASQKSSLGAEFTTTERAFYRFLEKKYGSKEVANLAAFDILKAIDEHRDHMKLLQLFAMAMTGGWYDADWKYILRCQQFVFAVTPKGFSNLQAVENFLHRYLYRDAEQEAIQRFIKGFSVFPSYNRQLARGIADEVDEAIPGEMFAEYIAHLLYMREEPKIRKVEIMHSVAKMDQHESVSYDQFEAFVGMCIPVERNVQVCQLYYRMLAKAYPSTNFPVRSVIHSVAACELETLMAYHSCDRELEVSKLIGK